MNSQIRAQLLTGDHEGRFVRRFQAIIRAARLNERYPDGRRLSAHVGAMDPRVHRGEYDGVEVNVDSGLPTYREWTRVQTDVSIATDQLRKLGDRAELARRARDSDHDVHGRQLAKYDYYHEIADTPLARLGEMDVALRHVEPRTHTAHFHVTFDKLDASGLFLRFSIDLTQCHRAWDTPVVELDDDTASHTAEFQSLIYKFSSMDAEFTFSKLEGLSGISVQRVCRATVGPFYYGFLDVPEPFDDIIDEEEAFVAMFAVDNAACDVRQTRNNDPFGELFADEMAQRMRPTYARARDQFDYRVYRDRKFVVSRGLEGALQSLCQERGTKNIVYSI